MATVCAERSARCQTTPAGLELPYVRQPSNPRHRLCGAAALAMIYRWWNSGGSGNDDLLCSTIATRINCSDGRGGSFARCHRLAADLNHAGIPTAALHATHPRGALLAGRYRGPPTHVKFRLRLDSPLGHFAVVAGIDDEQLWLHDPQLGAEQPWERDQFLRHWQAGPMASEIAGRGFLVSAAPRQVAGHPAIAWQSQRCHGCGRNYVVPCAWELLAKVRGVFCPGCDRGWQLRVQRPALQER